MRIRTSFAAALLTAMTATGCMTPAWQQSGVCRDCQRSVAGRQQGVVPLANSAFTEDYLRREERNGMLQAQLEQMQIEMERLRSTVGQYRQQDRVMQASLQDAEKEVGVTHNELRTANRSIEALRDDVGRLVTEVRRLDEYHTGQLDQFSRRLDDMLLEYGRHETTHRDGGAKASLQDPQPQPYYSPRDPMSSGGFVAPR